MFLRWSRRRASADVWTGVNVPNLKLTAEIIKALEVPAYGESFKTRQVIYRDTEQPGLGVRVTSGGARVYVVNASHGGRDIRVKLARCTDLTLTQARQRARQISGDIAKGVNPNVERRADRARGVTLSEAFKAFIATRKAARRLAPRTEYDYRRIVYGARNADGSAKLNGYLSPWQARPLAEISPEQIARRHAELLERSGAQANYAMRLLSAVFNFAGAHYRVAGAPLFTANPVKILSDTKAWMRLERRSSVVQVHQLRAWFKAVRELESPANNHLAGVVRDWLQLLILTGLRAGESARLKWADVDLQARIFTVRDTKNRSDHTLPLSDYLLELFSARPREGLYVFPGALPDSHLVEPKKMLNRVREASRVAFTPHDLRRTFASIAESIDVPAYALKRLLNHKMKNDVTAGYIVTDVERLRAPMQKITDFVLRAAGVRASAEVFELAPLERTGSGD